MPTPFQKLLDDIFSNDDNRLPIQRENPNALWRLKETIDWNLYLSYQITDDDLRHCDILVSQLESNGHGDSQYCYAAREAFLGDTLLHIAVRTGLPEFSPFALAKAILLEHTLRITHYQVRHHEHELYKNKILRVVRTAGGDLYLLKEKAKLLLIKNSIGNNVLHELATTSDGAHSLIKAIRGLERVRHAAPQIIRENPNAIQIIHEAILFSTFDEFSSCHDTLRKEGTQIADESTLKLALSFLTTSGDQFKRALLFLKRNKIFFHEKTPSLSIFSYVLPSAVEQTFKTIPLHFQNAENTAPEDFRDFQEALLESMVKSALLPLEASILPTLQKVLLSNRVRKSIISILPPQVRRHDSNKERYVKETIKALRSYILTAETVSIIKVIISNNLNRFFKSFTESLTLNEKKSILCSIKCRLKNPVSKKTPPSSDFCRIAKNNNHSDLYLNFDNHLLETLSSSMNENPLPKQPLDLFSARISDFYSGLARSEEPQSDSQFAESCKQLDAAKRTPFFRAAGMGNHMRARDLMPRLVVWKTVTSLNTNAPLPSFLSSLFPFTSCFFAVTQHTAHRLSTLEDAFNRTAKQYRQGFSGRDVEAKIRHEVKQESLKLSSIIAHLFNAIAFLISTFEPVIDYSSSGPLPPCINNTTNNTADESPPSSSENIVSYIYLGLFLFSVSFSAKMLLSSTRDLLDKIERRPDTLNLHLKTAQIAFWSWIVGIIASTSFQGIGVAYGTGHIETNSSFQRLLIRESLFASASLTLATSQGVSLSVLDTTASSYDLITFPIV